MNTNETRAGKRYVGGLCVRCCFLGMTLLLLRVAENRVMAAEPAWESLGPLLLKANEPVSLQRNPLQQARQAAQVRTVSGRTKRDFIVKLKRHLEEQVRGVVQVNGRSLLLLGGRVCQVGQEIPLGPGVMSGSASVAVRIKSLEGGRLVLLLSEPESEEAGCEEWVYQMSEFLTQI